MDQAEHKIFTKIAWRLIPFILLLYLINYIDRVNIGFAGLTMNQDLGLSPSVFGFAAGIFFFSYSVFQIPGNIIMQRIGARRWVFSILIVWGLISASTAFVTGPYSLYTLRFLLGVAESGFFPGMLLYLTFWFPQAYLGRFIGMFMTGIPLAFIIGGPTSSLILQMDGVLGFHGWQWLFIIEGLPAAFLSLAVLKLMPDGPAQAEWLTAEEKRIVTARLASETHVAESHNIWAGLLNIRIIAVGMVLAGIQFGLYGVQLWIPQIVQSMGYSTLATGFLVAIPFIAGGIGMVLWARKSDRSGERIWHIAIPCLFGAGGLLFGSMMQNDFLVILGLTCGLIGILSIEGPLFSLPKLMLSGAAAASGIALVNSLGSLGRLFGPIVMGELRESTGGYSSGLAALAVGLIFSAGLVLILGRVMAHRAVKYT